MTTFKNESGITPLLDRVVVLPDPIEEETEGGIILSSQVQESHQYAQAMGTLVAVGPDAYVHSRVYVQRVIDGDLKLVEVRTEQWDPEYTPKPGDRIEFAKYGGLINIGLDGKEYRTMNDRDITAKIEEGVKYTGIQSRTPMGQRS